MARTQAHDYQDKRDAIMAAAARLFGASGFAGTSMSELAKACHMSKSLLYHYYTAKEDILRDVTGQHMRELMRLIEHFDMDGQGPEDTLLLLSLIHI